MKNLKKNLFKLFLLIYLLIGSYNSINTGISFDEKHEEFNWNFNIKLVKDLTNVFVGGDSFDRQEFDQEVKLYVGYGVGSQFISQPIQFFLKDFLLLDKNLDLYGAKLLSKHFVIFLFFFVSGIFFYLILKKLIDNEIFCIMGTIFYLTYPYLFGQAMFSPKDIPFLSIWLVCTYVSFNVIEKLINKKIIRNKDIFIFSLVTAFLISIRIAGFLIFLQYFILLLLFLNIYKEKFIYFLKSYYKKFFFFFLNLLILIFILNPIFLVDPFLFFESINVSANHFNNVGTNTFGEMMYSINLPSTYLPIWLAVKIPLIIILGLIILPFTEKKIFNKKKISIYFGTILITVILIPLILIIKKVHLYDELRQVMFLIPLIIILGLVSLYTISKLLFFILSILTISFFILENIKINPYQYVWFNFPSRYLDLTNKFELEYQGISGKEIAHYLSNMENQNNCILANPIHGVKPFLNNTNFKCFDIWQKVDTDFPRPFLAVQNVRNLKKSLPYNCKSIYETGFKLLFHKEKFVTGKLLFCD